MLLRQWKYTGGPTEARTDIYHDDAVLEFPRPSGVAQPLAGGGPRPDGTTTCPTTSPPETETRVSHRVGNNATTTPSNPTPRTGSATTESGRRARLLAAYH